MSKIAIMTDSNSGITQKQAEEMGISVLPMPFMIDGQTYLEGVSLTHEEFYEKLIESDSAKAEANAAMLTQLDKALEEINTKLGKIEEIERVRKSLEFNKSILPAKEAEVEKAKTEFETLSEKESEKEAISQDITLFTQELSLYDESDALKEALNASKNSFDKNTLKKADISENLLGRGTACGNGAVRKRKQISAF